ncbi:MAG: hypothetical protein Q4G64_06015, partial [bacterium]|nr:hypothetical protein [bacterium]
PAAQAVTQPELAGASQPGFRGIQPTVCSGPNQPVHCSVGGSEGGGGGGRGGQASGGFDDRVNYTSDTCGSWGDLNGDGAEEYLEALENPVAGWSMSENGCSITNNVTGEVLRWQVVFAAWVQKTGNGGAPVPYAGGGGPPTWCEGYNPSGSWYWGIVVGSTTPQPIWGNPSTSTGACPTPGADPVELAGNLVQEYIDAYLTTGELGISPPEGAYPANVGVPVRLWFEDPVPGETVGVEEPIVRSEGPVSVSMDIELEDVTVDWGDGTQTMCEYNPESGTVGTPFAEGQDPVTFDSGCQHVYEAMSSGQPDDTYTISAVSNWQVTWSVSTSAGTEGGVENVSSQSEEVTVQVGEIQAKRR